MRSFDRNLYDSSLLQELLTDLCLINKAESHEVRSVLLDELLQRLFDENEPSDTYVSYGGVD